MPKTGWIVSLKQDADVDVKVTGIGSAEEAVEWLLQYIRGTDNYVAEAKISLARG